MKYNIVNVEKLKQHEAVIKIYKVSKKARSESGFYYNYLKHGEEILDQPSDQPKLTWGKKRDLFIDRTLPAYLKKPTIRRFLSLLAWAYNPGPLYV